MDSTVDSFSNAYRDLLTASSSFLVAGSVRGPGNSRCPGELMQSFKQRIGLECLVNEATGSAAGNPWQAAVLQEALEQLSDLAS